MLNTQTKLNQGTSGGQQGGETILRTSIPNEESIATDLTTDFGLFKIRKYCKGKKKAIRWLRLGSYWVIKAFANRMCGEYTK